MFYPWTRLFPYIVESLIGGAVGEARVGEAPIGLYTEVRKTRTLK